MPTLRQVEHFTNSDWATERKAHYTELLDAIRAAGFDAWIEISTSTVYIQIDLVVTEDIDTYIDIIAPIGMQDIGDENYWWVVKSTTDRDNYAGVIIQPDDYSISKVIDAIRSLEGK